MFTLIAGGRAAGRRTADAIVVGSVNPRSWFRQKVSAARLILETAASPRYAPEGRPARRS
jgi:hypothetical protein